MLSSNARLSMRAFCAQFHELCDDLDRIFSQDVDVRTATTAIRTLLVGNPKLLARVFKTHVADPYAESFTEGNLSFFLDKDYSHDIKMDNASMIIAKVDSLRDPIKRMSPDCHNKVLKYFGNMSKLVKFIFEDKVDLKGEEST